MPQVPQFASEVCVSTQAPLHVVCPVGQLPIMQVPLWQISPMAQAWPQVPQWSELLEVSAHMPLHSICGGVQLSRQVPATHAWTAVHAFPQVPQFSRSLEVSAEHVPEPPLPSPPPSPGSLLEQATKHDKPKRIEPPKSHRGRERVLLSDRMTEPFLCSIKQRDGFHGAAAPGPEFPNSAT
jgi:hypothetical protein